MAKISIILAIFISSSVYCQNVQESTTAPNSQAGISFDPNKNYYTEYLLRPISLGPDERTRFSTAMEFIRKQHSLFDQRNLEAFNRAKERYEAERLTNASNADEKLLIASQAFDELKKSNRLTLLKMAGLMRQVHRQRINRLNNMARENAEQDLDNEVNKIGKLQRKEAINELPALLGMLIHYLKAEERERIHRINMYEFDEEHSPGAARSELEPLRLSLQEIESRISKTLKKISANPTANEFLRPAIEKFLDDYKDVDEETRYLFPLGLWAQSFQGKTNAPRQPKSPPSMQPTQKPPVTQQNAGIQPSASVAPASASSNQIQVDGQLNPEAGIRDILNPPTSDLDEYADGDEDPSYLYDDQKRDYYYYANDDYNYVDDELPEEEIDNEESAWRNAIDADSQMAISDTLINEEMEDQSSEEYDSASDAADFERLLKLVPIKTDPFNVIPMPRLPISVNKMIEKPINVYKDTNPDYLNAPATPKIDIDSIDDEDDDDKIEPVDIEEAETLPTQLPLELDDLVGTEYRPSLLRRMGHIAREQPLLVSSVLASSLVFLVGLVLLVVIGCKQARHRRHYRPLIVSSVSTHLEQPSKIIRAQPPRSPGELALLEEAELRRDMQVHGYFNPNYPLLAKAEEA